MKRTRAQRLPPAVKVSIAGLIVALALILPLSRIYLPAQADTLMAAFSACIAALFVYIGVTDIVSGEIRSSRYGVTMVVRRRDTPISFWALTCVMFLGAGMFLLFAAGHLHAGACCNPAALRRFISHITAAALVAMCVHVGETVIADLKTGEVRAGAGRKPLAMRNVSPRRYWASIALRIGFLAGVAGLIIALYASPMSR